MQKTDEFLEKVLYEALDNLKERVRDTIEDVASNLYTEYLPHVLSDTEANLSYRIANVLENILGGKFEILRGKYISVADNRGRNYFLKVAVPHTQIAQALYRALGPEIENAVIDDLRNQIKVLEEAKRNRW